MSPVDSGLYILSHLTPVLIFVLAVASRLGWDFGGVISRTLGRWLFGGRYDF